MSKRYPGIVTLIERLIDREIEIYICVVNRPFSLVNASF